MSIDTEKQPPLAGDDYSDNFLPLRKALVEGTQGDYLQFVANLTPAYRRVWLDITLGYFYLALVIYLVGQPTSLLAQLSAGLGGAIGIGYGIAYLQLFLHEASHYNLARDRAISDGICDVLISWQIGTTVKRYRPVHFAHHRQLGTTADSENSYFNSLSLHLIIATLTGIHALRILLNRNRRLDRQATGADRARRSVAPLLRGLTMHGLVCIGSYLLSGWPGLMAWILGVGAFFPLFATLRQLLEHRSIQADPNQDYTQKDHGAVTRMFGTGPLASTFGGAGFNRHLLHHWEPQVSYTRLADLERYLADTAAGPVIETRRGTYLATAAALWRSAHSRSGSKGVL